MTNLEVLSLAGCNLLPTSNSISSDFPSQLKELVLDGNDFSESLPTELEKLKTLEALSLYSCRLKDLPESLSCLQHLRKLALDGNDLHAGLPSVVGKLKSLETLRLVTCNLTDLPLSLLLLPLLKELILDGNDFSSGVPAVVCQLPQLETLSLYSCQVQDLPERFQSQANLQNLELGFNKLARVPSGVYQMENLQHLSFCDNHNLKRIESKVSQLKNLRELDCENCVSLLFPPYEVSVQGFGAVCKFFTDLESGKGNRLLEIPVAVVGMQRSGKSSLIQSLKAGERKLTIRDENSPLDETTKVFQIENLDLVKSRLKLIDYAGHDIYHMAYQLVIKERCIPLLVINIEELKSLSLKEGFEEATRKVCFDWLAHLYLAGPRLGPPVLSLTHTDKLTFDELAHFKKELLNRSETLRIKMLKESQQLAAKGSRSNTPIVHFANTAVPLFDPEDIFEFNNDSKEKKNIVNLKACLEKQSQMWAIEAPCLWEKIEEFVETQQNKPYIVLSQITSSFVTYQPLTILRYMHNTGKIFWFEEIDELSQYVFHRIPVITEMINILFHHSSDVLWQKRQEKFTAFCHNGRPIGKLKFKALVKEFTTTGVIGEALLIYLLQTESSFSPSVAIDLLKSFNILYGPISKKGDSKAYILPYFAKSSMDDSFQQDNRIPLRMDIAFGGLSLPQYVFQLITVVVLNCVKSHLTEMTVHRNGTAINHGECSTYLLHDYDSRNITLQVSTSVQQLGLSWQHLIETAWATLKLISRVWKASFSEVLVYCGQCLIVRNNKPNYYIDPDWFYPADGKLNLSELSTVTTISSLEKVACKRCEGNGENRPGVPKPLRFPCTTEVASTSLHTNQTDESDISDVDEEGYCAETPKNIHMSLRLKPVKEKRVKQLYHNPEKVYLMSDRVRGRVLIINNVNFPGFPSRLGSEVDYYHLCKLFKDLRFSVAKTESKLSFTAEKMYKTVIEETNRKDHYDYGMFVLVLMSHGTKGDVILDSQGKSVYFVHFQDLLCPRNFPAMKGKPKLIIVQACSGERADVGEVGDVPSVTASSNNQSQDLPPDLHLALRPKEYDDGPCSVTAHTCLNADDFLILKASSESYVATRSTSHGSWFIRVLVATFYKHSNHRDVESLFKIIQQRVRQVSLTHKSANTCELRGNVPVSKCTFTNYRKLYLFPGFPTLRD
ncbi:uncharacterized protein [Watersipora subatra]|uniref:uncharacterized protein isoform X2 n=1 Tax=Watersipora subatra TaxID=2589382 RepID=UPI00355B96B7